MQKDEKNYLIEIHFKKYSQILALFVNSFQKNIISKINANPTNPNEKSFEIFKENFDILDTELLKNEDSNTIIGKIDKNSEYFFTSRVSNSKYEIVTQQLQFFDSLKKFSLNIKCKSSLDGQILKFCNKGEYVKFVFKYCSDAFLKQRFFLRVSKLMIL